MKKILTLTAILLAAFGAKPAFAAADGCTPNQDWGTVSIAAAQQIVDLTNQERAKSGVSPLRPSVALTRIAMYRALHMARFGDYNHTSDAATAVVCGYASQVGANIGADWTSPAEAIAGWMKSPEHKHAIVNPAVDYIGVGVAHGATGWYWVQFFAIDPDGLNGDPYGDFRDWPSAAAADAAKSTDSNGVGSSGATSTAQGLAPLVATLIVTAGQSKVVNATRFAMLADGTPVKAKLIKIVKPASGHAVRVGAGSIRYSAAAGARRGLVKVRFQVRAANGKTAWGLLRVAVLGR